MVPKMGTALDPFYKCLSQKDTFHLSVEMEYGGFLQSALIQVSVEDKTIQGLELNRLLGQALKQAHTHTSGVQQSPTSVVLVILCLL